MIVSTIPSPKKAKESRMNSSDEAKLSEKVVNKNLIGQNNTFAKIMIGAN
jgi:hypothetical protein